MNRQQADSVILTHDFAGYELKTKGLGVYFLSERAKSEIGVMSKERAKEVNNAAWKVSKVQCAILNRHCNASIPGNSNIYDVASVRYDVAKAITKLTYRVMMGYV